MSWRTAWLWLALLVAASSVVARPALAVQRTAIVVGANRAPPGRSDLRYAHEDARAVARVLVQVGEFAADDVVTLLDPTPAEVLGALDARIARMSGGPESLVLFYYSGHSDPGALYPRGEPLGFEELRRRLSDPRITVRLGIVDACRGGGWTGAKGLEAAPVFDVSQALALNNEGSVLIASSSGLEDAHESEVLQGSFFTHHLNAGLRGAADKNADAEVSMVEVFEYARALTIRDTALAASAPQHPSFQMNLSGRQDLRMANLERGESWMLLDQRQGPLEVVHLGSGVVLLELPSGSRAARVAVPPGRYLVRSRYGGQIHGKEYDVDVGRVTNVSEAELELSGASELLLKGPGSDEWLVRYYVLGGGGAHDGLTHAFSESRSGRIAPGDVGAGYLGLAAASTLGFELTLPGRFGFRLNAERFGEWVFWVGLPLYLAPDGDGKARPFVGVGAGLDSWQRLGPSSRLGINLGATAFDDGRGELPKDVLRAFGSLGLSQRLGERWSVHLGVGYAENVSYERDPVARPYEVGAQREIVLGSVMTDGIWSLPLVEYRASDSLSLGVYTQASYLPDEHAFNFELSLGWVWSFTQLEMQSQ